MNLEEFGYQFGVHGAENLISKLNQIETETEQLDDAVKHLGNTFQQLFDIALRSSIPPAFIKMVMDQAMAFSKQAEYIDRLAQTSGISAKSIQQLGYALHRFGGDVSIATMQLDQLQGKLEKFWKPINKGGGLASELAQLAKKHKVDLNGVTSSIDLLKAIAVRMEKLSERKKIDLARAFGLDDSTFLMVKNGLKSLEESLYKAQKFVLFDDKEIRQAKEFEDTLRDIADNITLISKSFSFGAIPTMQKFANVMRTITDFMSEHKDVVKGIGLTAFGAGVFGIFRLLNFIPTKFLKRAAGVFGAGFAIGTINEEVEKLNKKQRDKTFIGTLENLGYKSSAHYLELIYRAIHNLTTDGSLDGIKDLSDNVGKDLGIKSLQKENASKSIKESGNVLSEYASSFKKYGIEGLVARSMTSGDTVQERATDFTKNRKEIQESGGVFSFLWNKLEVLFTDIKDTLKSIFTDIGDTLESIFLDIADKIANLDFVDSIIDAIDNVFDELKDLFTDLFSVSGGTKSFKDLKLDDLKSPLINRIKTTDKNNKLLKSIKSGEKKLEDVSFNEVFKQFLLSEWRDFYRNWISLDKTIENLGTIFEKTSNILTEINNILAGKKNLFKQWLDELEEAVNTGKSWLSKTAKMTTAVTGAKGGASAGAAIGGAIAGPAGVAVGTLAGGLVGGTLGYAYGVDVIKKYFESDYNLDQFKQDAQNYFKGGGNKEDLQAALNDKIKDINKEINSLYLQSYDAETDVVSNALFDSIEKKKLELAKTKEALALAQSQAILEGSKNIETMGNKVAANTNNSAVNNNSQENVVNINQTINIGKTVSTADDIGIASMNGARTGTQDGLRQATNNRVMGNAN